MSTELSSEEIASLFALYAVTEGKLEKHVPREAVTRKVRKDLRGFAREGLKSIVRKGCAALHPTRGGMTYQITKKGIQVLRDLRLIE